MTVKGSNVGKRISLWLASENEKFWNAVPNGEKGELFNLFLQDVAKGYHRRKKVIRTKEEAEAELAKRKPSGKKMCKNFHIIPEGRTGCMIKGCRYFQ